MNHLDIWNTSYGQKKGRELNWQFDFQPLKVKNHPDFLAHKWHATYRWKALDKGYNFSLYLMLIKGFHAKLWAPKVEKILIVRISGLSFGSHGTKCHLDVSLVERHRVRIRAVMNLVSPNLPMACSSTKSVLIMY
jgi:hypothetical protein